MHCPMPQDATLRRRIAILLAAAVAGCDSPDRAVSPEAPFDWEDLGPAQAISYQIDFADTEAVHGWVNNDVGTWEIADGRLLLHGGERFFMSMGPTVHFAGDLDLTVQTQWMRGSVTGGYGVTWRARVNRDNYVLGYGFVITAAGRYSVLRWDGEKPGNPPVFLIEWTESAAINPFGANDLQVIAVADTLRFLANGTHVGTVVDDRHSEGRVGLIVEDEQQVSFDDLDVRGFARGAASTEDP